MNSQGHPETTEPTSVAPNGAEIEPPAKKDRAHLSQTRTEEERQEYIHLIRDGHADRVEATIRGVFREMQIGRKTDRFSDAARRLTVQFEEVAQEFFDKKELLSRVEGRLGPLRRLVAEQPDIDEIREMLGHDRTTAEKMSRLLRETAILRDQLIDMTGHLLQLWDRIDEQARADEKQEQHLRAHIVECLQSFTAKKRVRFEVKLERSIRGKRLQQRLEVLQRYEQALADASPEGRVRRKEKLLVEAHAHIEAGDFQQVIAVLEQVYRLDRADEAVVIELAKTHMEHGRPERAIAVLKDYLRGGESIPALLTLALCFEKNAQPDDALTVYDRAIRFRPKDLDIRVAYCLALVRFDRAGEALEQLLELHARHPEATQVSLAVARVCISTGQPRKAREVLVQLTEGSPDHVEGWSELANVYWESRQLDEAERAYRRVLELDGSHFRALIHLADLERQRGDYPAAEELYLAAEKVNGNSHSVHLGLGIVLRETGRPADAVTSLERAIALNPQDGETYHHLGLACLLAGDPARAAEVMGRAVSFGFSGS